MLPRRHQPSRCLVNSGVGSGPRSSGACRCSLGRSFYHSVVAIQARTGKAKTLHQSLPALLRICVSAAALAATKDSKVRISRYRHIGCSFAGTVYWYLQRSAVDQPPPFECRPVGLDGWPALRVCVSVYRSSSSIGNART